jgi:dTMP kinase
MQKNLFIAFEGIDGSGKSTQVKLLAEKLISEGHKVYTTCEPTSGPIGKMIRSVFSGAAKADHRTIAALFLADRLEHLTNEVDGLLLKLKQGYTVITDRYYFSSYAYHSVYVDMDWVIATNSICADLLRPDLTIYIDISPEVSMQRINAGREALELYETEDNLRQVRSFYQMAFDKLKAEEKVFTTAGNRSPEAISESVWAEVSKRIQ